MIKTQVEGLVFDDLIILVLGRNGLAQQLLTWHAECIQHLLIGFDWLVSRTDGYNDDILLNMYCFGNMWILRALTNIMGYVLISISFII